MGIGMMVHAGAEIDQPLRPFDQRGEDIGRERVDREDMRQAVGGDAVAFAIADGGVVNDRASLPVGLVQADPPISSR
jgi:hypothetical protein